MPETCPRMKATKKLLKHTPEYKKLEKDNKVCSNNNFPNKL
jgi:hypothetical protein